MREKKDGLRVLFICDFAASFPGSFIESIYSLAASISGQGGQVWFIFPAERDCLKRLSWVGEVHYVPSFQGKKFDLKLHKHIKKLVRSRQIQLIHSHFGLAGFITGCLVSFRLPCVHIAHERTVSKYYYSKTSFFRRFFVKIFFRFYDLLSRTKYIAISSEVKNSLIQYNGLEKNKIAVIPNAVLAKRTESIETVHIPYLEKMNKRLVVGMVAHMGPAKDHMSLLKAAQKVTKRIPAVIFVFVGGNLANDPGDTRAMLEKLSKEMDLQDHVLFTGEIPDPYPFIERFEIGLLISNWEGFGNVLVEYMLRKKPVIGTSVGGIKDIIIDGENGFLVPPCQPEMLADKILWLLEHPDAAKQMGKKGYLRAKKEYSMELWIERINRVYQFAIN